MPSVQRLLGTREHQDANELFLLLIGAMEDEVQKLEVEMRKDKGLAGIETKKSSSSSPSPIPSASPPTRLQSPWQGLSANRRNCMTCGYCESIRFEVMGGMDVSVPMSVSYFISRSQVFGRRRTFHIDLISSLT